LVEELNKVLVSRIERDVKNLADGARFEGVKEQVLARTLDPYEAADRLLQA
jgi:hypothetical protein